MNEGIINKHYFAERSEKNDRTFKTESVKWSYISRQHFFCVHQRKKTAKFDEVYFFSLFLWEIL